VVLRCFGDSDDLMREYHDREWGRPLHDEHALYEKLCLECMQSGLSWSLVLRKREGFRAAFAGFDPEVVARFGPRDVERLLGDASIIRNRRKIDAVIVNARATVAMRDSGPALDELVWSFRPEPGPAPNGFEDWVPQTAESKALAKALKQRGFVFVGPTTVYSTMQAAGLVNDHLAGCIVRDEVQREQELALEGRPIAREGR
jgi:DNA-3-methyladenine glycosylase I